MRSALIRFVVNASIIALCALTAPVRPFFAAETEDSALYDFYCRRMQQGETLTPAEKEQYLAIKARMVNDRERYDGLDNQGGPDAFNYYFVDNIAPDTATFSWTELRGDPGATWLTGSAFTDPDDGYSFQKLPIGFSFPFYGTSYDCVRVCCNGFLNFSTTIASFSNGCLPSTNVNAPMVAMLWDDLHLLHGGRTDTVVIGYRSFGDRMVIEYDQVGYYSPSCPDIPLSFEALLFSNGNIKLQYDHYSAPEACDSSQTIGIQSNGAVGSAALTYVCDFDGIQPGSGRAIWFFRPNGIPLPCTNLAASVVGHNVTLTWVDPTQDLQGNPLTPDNVQVWLGAAGTGSLLTTVNPGVQTYLHTYAPTGSLTYSVRAFHAPFFGAPASVQVRVGTPSYANDFEHDAGMWVPEPPTGGWEWDRPTVPSTLIAHSGVSLWCTVLDANYPANACLTLTLNLGLVVQSPRATVEFWRWWDTEQAHDGVNFKASTDGGNTWILVQPVGGYPYTASEFSACLPLELFWSGHEGGTWTQIVLPIGQFVGRTPLFRFYFGSNGTIQYPGFFFDDMVIWGLGSSSSRVIGTVRDCQTDLPIAGVQVWAVGTYDTTTTDTNGAYQAWLDPGTYAFTYHHPHYYDSTYNDIIVVADSQTTQDAVLRPRSGERAMDQTAALPREFACFQNYPNPFNVTTTIRFDVPQTNAVQIVIYNVVGQEVARPVDAIYPPGRYEVLFDGKNLPSGMYVVELSARHFSRMSKMLLLK
jgi:hypothetical protein